MKLFFPAVIFLSIALGISLNSCQNEPYTALSYHDSLVTEQVKISQAISELNAALETFYEEDMNKAYALLGKQLEKSNQKLSSMPPFKGDEVFLNATKILVDEHSKLHAVEYKQSIDLLLLPDSLFLDEQELKVNELLKKIDAKLEKIISDYSKAEQNFSQKYDLVKAQ